MQSNTILTNTYQFEMSGYVITNETTIKRLTHAC